MALRLTSDGLHAALRDGIARHGVPGASAAILRANEVTAAAAGVANTRTGVALTPETVMHIGSITKVVNATLIMQLVDAGQVDLDAPIASYLPDLRLRDAQALQRITVRMLLDHTSGIDGDGLPDHGHDEETLEKGIARAAQLGQLHPPGAEYSYCNVATAIAGYLAQRLTGTSWYRLVKQRIFDPLQMEHAATLPEEALLHRASVGHFRSASPGGIPVRVSRAFLPFGFAPAGASLMVSARDLITFARAHIGNGLGPNGVRVLSERSAVAMRQLSVNNQGKGYTYTDGIGIGWMVCSTGLLHHSGGGPGIVSVLYLHPERELALALLTNAEFGLSWGLVSELVAAWLAEVGIEVPVGMAAVSLPKNPVSIDAERFVGEYESSSIRYRVVRGHRGLTLSMQWKRALYEYISTEPTPPALLVPVGHDRFALSVDEQRGEFRTIAFRNPNSEGRMQHLGDSDRLYARTS